jgi:hypothetical protein
MLPAALCQFNIAQQRRSTDRQTIRGLVHGKCSAGIAARQQVNRHSVANKFFDGVTHRARSQLGMETATDKEWQNGIVRFEFVAFNFQEL